MQKLISVIVPIYKVEPYLDRCIQSIQNQTYRNLEIILVDDGSPDRCGEISDRYAAEDARITVIHKPNGGLSDARNAGLAIAKGDYIAFVDSDDFIHPQMYERMLQAAEKEKADMVISDWQKVAEGERPPTDAKTGDDNIQVIDGKDIQYLYFQKPESRITYTVAWNKLYTRELFRGRCYPTGKVHEDEFITFKLIYDAKRIVYLPEQLYFYLVRDVSIMGDFNARRFDIFDAYAEKLSFFSQKEEKELASKIYYMAAHMLVQYLEWIDKKDENAIKIHKKYYELWKDLGKKYKKDIVRNTTQQVEFFLFNHCWSLYILMWKIKHMIRK